MLERYVPPCREYALPCPVLKLLVLRTAKLEYSTVQYLPCRTLNHQVISYSTVVTVTTDRAGVVVGRGGAKREARPAPASPQRPFVHDTNRHHRPASRHCPQNATTSTNRTAPEPFPPPGRNDAKCPPSPRRLPQAFHSWVQPSHPAYITARGFGWFVGQAYCCESMQEQ